MEQTAGKKGIIQTALSYVLWGFLPIYWKFVDNVSAGAILSHRIVWSFVFMLLLIIAVRKMPGFIKECHVLFTDKKKLLGITFASIVISINWLTYIWAVNNDHVIQASLGYYINPLVSILLGIVILKERLNRIQLLSFLIAAAGVINLTISYGVFPWISIVLACSFGLYGLLKKTVDISPMFGLTIETMIVTPLALIYLFIEPEQAFTAGPGLTLTAWLLIGAGAATAIPLLLFASGAKQIPLAMVGFLQYIAPTIMLFLGIYLYHETFTTAHFVSFAFIWLALIIYMASLQRRPIDLEQKKPQAN